MGDEDDNEGGSPTKYEFSTESKLDEDHLFYLQFTNNFISNVTRPRDFDHCSRWLEKLAGEPMYGVEAKRNRNMYLAMLLIAMQDNKVKGPFSTFPPPGALPPASAAFGLTSDEEQKGFQDQSLSLYDRELNMVDYKFKSEDGRTYMATCSLPNSGGVMGYIGMTFGGGEGLWLNKDGEKVSLTDVMCGERVETVDIDTPVKKQIEMMKSYDPSATRSDNEDSWPFKFIDKLPENRSDSNLVPLSVTSTFSPFRLKLLKEVYPDELVCVLEKLLVKSKCSINQRLRNRHTKVVEQMYKSYVDEAEQSLKDYKLARQEWQQVMNVIQSLKQVEAEYQKQEADIAGSSSDCMRMLGEAYNEAVIRKSAAHRETQLLEKQKHELHKDIHERALIHKHELDKLNKHVEKLIGDIKKLRNDSRRKQQMIDSLVQNLKERQAMRYIYKTS